MSWCNPFAWWRERRQRIKKQKQELSMRHYAEVIATIKVDLEAESKLAKEALTATIYHRKYKTGGEMTHAVTYIQHIREMEKLNKEMMKESAKLQTVKRSNRMDKS